MLLVLGITAGTGTESDETPGWWWPVGLSQSEGAHEMAGSVDGALFRVPGHLGVGRPSIYTTAFECTQMPAFFRSGLPLKRKIYGHNTGERNFAWSPF
jgi:hypothetical protein